MPINRPALINNEIYHLILRGVGDTEIFREDNDYWRAIFSIYEFNTTSPIEIRIQRAKRKKAKNGEQFSDNRKLLVSILAFCFMPNHIHLLVCQKNENGITRFMRKFGAGYAAYFNKKYDRKGHLFQGRFRAGHVASDDLLKIISTYIHTNPVSLFDSKWKERGTKNIRAVIEKLKNYKWSSYPDYLGANNFPSVTDRALLDKLLGGKFGAEKAVVNWVKEKGRLLNEIEAE